MNNSTLLMVGILAAVAMLSVAVVVLPSTMQQASAEDTILSFKNKAKNSASGFATIIHNQLACLNLDSGGGSCRIQ
jgi:hypothetical protein